MIRICKSWEKQVLDNSNELEQLRETVDGSTSDINQLKRDVADIDQIKEDVSNIDSDITEINQKLAKTLVTPLSRPTSTELVAVDNTNSQSMLEVGEGLTVENGTLKTTGGASPFTLVYSSYISADDGYQTLTGVGGKVALFEVEDADVPGNKGAAIFGFGSYEGGQYYMSLEISVGGQNLVLEFDFDYDGIKMAVLRDGYVLQANIKIYTIDLPQA